MEKKIVQALGFNLSKPLPIHFLRRFAKAAAPLGDRQYTAAKYFMELASIDYEMTMYNPSMVRRLSRNSGFKNLIFYFNCTDRCSFFVSFALHLQCPQGQQRVVDTNARISLDLLRRWHGIRCQTLGISCFDCQRRQAEVCLQQILSRYI